MLFLFFMPAFFRELYFFLPSAFSSYWFRFHFIFSESFFSLLSYSPFSMIFPSLHAFAFISFITIDAFFIFPFIFIISIFSSLHRDFYWAIRRCHFLHTIFLLQLLTLSLFFRSRWWFHIIDDSFMIYFLLFSSSPEAFMPPLFSAFSLILIWIFSIAAFLPSPSRYISLCLRWYCFFDSRDMMACLLIFSDCFFFFFLMIFLAYYSLMLIISPLRSVTVTPLLCWYFTFIYLQRIFFSFASYHFHDVVSFSPCFYFRFSCFFFFIYFIWYFRFHTLFFRYVFAFIFSFHAIPFISSAFWVFDIAFFFFAFHILRLFISFPSSLFSDRYAAADVDTPFRCFVVICSISPFSSFH